jgi:predicted aspartyl protease
LIRRVELEKAMRMFPLATTIVTLVWLSTQMCGAAAPSSPAALKTFLEREGYGGSPLQRRLGNHLFVTTLMNGRRTALMIDTGSPQTLIDRGTIHSLGVPVRGTRLPVGGVWGWKPEHYGVSKLATLTMGNCTFTNVPITVADESHINKVRGPHLDGLFGAHEMSKFGMVIDCTRQMIYVNPRGPSEATTQKLAEFLAGRGFTRIPMRFDERQHLAIDATLNGHPTRLIVDTGASTTLLASSVAHSCGVSLSPLNIRIHDTTAGTVPINIGHIQQLTLGSLRIPNAEVVVAQIAKEVGAGLLGEEYLSWNFGIVDVGGMNLYLRPPESASAKKR